MASLLVALQLKIFNYPHLKNCQMFVSDFIFYNELTSAITENNASDR